MYSSSGSYGTYNGKKQGQRPQTASPPYQTLSRGAPVDSDLDDSELGFDKDDEQHHREGTKAGDDDSSFISTSSLFRSATTFRAFVVVVLTILVVTVAVSTHFDFISTLRVSTLLKSPSEDGAPSSSTSSASSTSSSSSTSTSSSSSSSASASFDGGVVSSTTSTSSTTAAADPSAINNLSSPTDVVTDVVSVSSTTTTTTSTTTTTTDVVSTPTDAQIAAGESVVFKFNRVGYSPISLADDVLYYSFLKDKDVVLEPFADMQLVVMDWSDTSVYYKFIVCKSEDTFKANCQTGSISLDGTVANVDVKVLCAAHDEYVIEVYGYSKTTGLQSVSYGDAICMYVRREIRQLSTTDLDDCMDAMYTMYSVTEEVGTELYGDEYKPSSYLLGFHHFNSAWQEADHIHEGNGFLPQHIKMTNIVESSLQAINPSIALPYWDYTIDQSEGKSSVNSALMTPTLFGSMSQPVDLSWGFTYASDTILGGAIPDGRWAFLAADKNDEYPDLKAAYGYMRAPWNMNPSPYISRFTMDLQVGVSLPSCQQHYDMLDYSTLMTFLYDIQYEPHATTHSLTGGIYGCDLLQPQLDAGYATDETSLKTICSNWLFYVKEFYRYNYITPNTDCAVSSDTQSSTCGFTCTTDETELTNFLFNLKNKLANYVPATMSDDGWKSWQDFICTGNGGKIFSGDHLESASPADPSFWVIHPTLERLYHAKLMAGGFDDTTWATDAVNDFVCDKAECYMSSYGDKDYYSECCYGHYEDSKFLDFTTGNKSSKTGDTNAAVLGMTDPRSEAYSMSYIYDGFTWKHCSQDFDSKLHNTN